MPTYRATSQNPTTNIASQPTGNLAASLFDSMFQTIWNVFNDSSNGYATLATDTGTVNNYVVANLSPALAYRQGMLQAFITANGNTGPAQINVDGLGNVVITTGAGNALVGGELSTGAINVLIHDGTKFRILISISGPYVVGDITQSGYSPSAIVVPSFKNFPDAIWTPYGTFDDHFDTPASGTPNAKWVQTLDSGVTSSTFTQAGSKLCLGVSSPAANATAYNNRISQNLPNVSPFRISFKVRPFFSVTQSATANISGVLFTLSYGAYAGGAQLFFRGGDNSSSLYVPLLLGQYGANFASSTYFMAATIPDYVQFTYDASKNTTIAISQDGITWFTLFTITAANSLFASNNPTQFSFSAQSSFQSVVFAQFDWVKFTNP